MINDLYKLLFGRKGMAEGSVIDMAEHGRTDNLSTGTAFKNIVGRSINGIELDYDGGTNPIYIGKAVPGSLTSEAKWQIQKLTFDGNNNPTSILFPGTAEFNQIWDNRASLTYS